jgi:hypothetical protein
VAAAPLEFKRRVRLAEPRDEERPARRRSYAFPLGAAVWTGVVVLAVAITEGVVPIESWLMQAIPTPSRPALARPSLPSIPVAAPQPQPVAPEPAVLEPALAQAAPAESAPAESAPAESAPAESAPELAAAEREPEQASAETAPPAPVLAPEPAPSLEPAAAISVASSGQSCEQAAASAVQSIEIGADPGPPDLAREDYASVLDRGDYFSHCGAPDATRIEICAAVQAGRAIGVTVRTKPGNPGVADCIARAVRSIVFPSHRRLDVVHTTFSPR